MGVKILQSKIQEHNMSMEKRTAQWFAHEQIFLICLNMTLDVTINKNEDAMQVIVLNKML